MHDDGGLGFAYFLTIIGAAVYFIQRSTGGFWGGVVGLLKALVWPAFVIYRVLGLLQM